jgi:hypothetical protein
MVNMSYCGDSNTWCVGGAVSEYTVANPRNPLAPMLPPKWACPYGRPGDRLWVKETFAYVRCSSDYETGSETNYWEWDKEFNGEKLPENLKLNPRYGSNAAHLCYRADGEDGNPSELYPMTDLAGKVVAKQEIPWSSSLFMWRWASRITLDVSMVRVERLNDISRGDCMAEGCPFPNMAKGADPREWYANLWESINGKGSWDLNPWVWVIQFPRMMQRVCLECGSSYVGRAMPIDLNKVKLCPACKERRVA